MYNLYEVLIMEKISVKVCLGTTCFVMGGSNLQELNDIIPHIMLIKTQQNTT